MSTWSPSGRARERQMRIAESPRLSALSRAFSVVATLSLALSLSACDVIQDLVRVPIVDVGASFTLADATWFEEEETLFIFYRVSAIEGLQEASVVELSYRTDTVDQPYLPLTGIEPVHVHVPVVCDLGEGYCGSFSVHVPDEPRDVDLRLRYHRDGELALNADVNFHVVATGPAHTNRSAIIYGVFNEENTHLQWRLRHLFPEIRNETASELGLLRTFQIEEASWGDIEGRDLFVDNPYGYGAFTNCPGNFDPHEQDVVTVSARARFDPSEYEIESYTSPYVCGESVIFDGTGTFRTGAVAQKNPQTRPAFPALQTPVEETVTLGYMFQVCDAPTSDVHQQMQRQRLSLVPQDVVCIDDWDTDDFSQRLATRVSADVDEARLAGDDLIITIALNRPDDPEIAFAIEQMLARVVAPERERSSPRVAGAFVFDTHAYSMRIATVSQTTLWCPSGFGGPDLDVIGDASARSCALQPTQVIPINETLSLAQLPILPDEDQFEEFIADYGVGQTGRVTATTFRAPKRTPTSDNMVVGDFGLATFFNEEAITPDPEDAFSYCAASDTGVIVFRIPGFDEVLPLSLLGEVHTAARLPRYELGLFWEFPYLMQLDYLATLAAAADLPEEIPFVAAFGLTSPAEEFLGSQQWTQQRFSLERALIQCDRFCDHPTFDSSGVYNVQESFREFAARCYRPRFPRVGDDGFPSDP